jgi:hypothetical protein
VYASLIWLFALSRYKSALSLKRFLNTTVECIHYCEVMERHVENWNDILVCVSASKLDLKL